MRSMTLKFESMEMLFTIEENSSMTCEITFLFVMSSFKTFMTRKKPVNKQWG